MGVLQMGTLNGVPLLSTPQIDPQMHPLNREPLWDPINADPTNGDPTNGGHRMGILNGVPLLNTPQIDPQMHPLNMEPL